MTSHSVVELIAMYIAVSSAKSRTLGLPAHARKINGPRTEHLDLYNFKLFTENVFPFNKYMYDVISYFLVIKWVSNILF